MESTRNHKLESLQQRGVVIPEPHSVQMDMHVDPDRIADGIVLHSGTKIFGAQTMIAQGCDIGREGPVTIENCYVGPGVQLKAGYFKNAVFLEGASLGFGAHVREGTILEEQASTAHCVGLKQTILMPFVTLGSLINFCDCLMAGGTSRENHSEVGSSFIHFNFTPNQDKATPSLLGDVPQGVMLDQSPIFMGGQGGLVGPCRIAFGTVSAAGTIVRKDQLKPDHLVFAGAGKGGGSIPWKPGRMGASNRILANNLVYIGNLCALREWYVHVRRMFISDRFPEILLHGLVKTLDMGLDERFKRLRTYYHQLNGPSVIERFDGFQGRLRESLRYGAENARRDRFLDEMTSQQASGASYIETVRSLAPETRLAGTHWLQSIVDQVMADGACLTAPST
jgi:hypothetical protein